MIIIENIRLIIIYSFISIENLIKTIETNSENVCIIGIIEAYSKRKSINVLTRIYNRILKLTRVKYMEF